MKFILLLLSCFLVSKMYTQTYVQPRVGYAINKVTNENVVSLIYPVLEKNSAPSFFIGLGVEQAMTKTVRFSFSVLYEKLFVSTTGLVIIRLSEDNIQTDFEPNPVIKVEHNRYILGFGTSISLFKKLYLNTSVNHTRTRSLNFLFSDGNRPSVPINNEKEMDFKVGFTYALTENLDMALSYRNVFWQNDFHFGDELDPLQSIGVQFGYRFKVLDKFKKKSKVRCPKM